MQNCCQPTCCIPGPQGPAGATGPAGANGLNAPGYYMSRWTATEIPSLTTGTIFTFNNGLQLSDALTYDAGSGKITYNCAETRFFRITYDLTPTLTFGSSTNPLLVVGLYGSTTSFGMTITTLLYASTAAAAATRAGATPEPHDSLTLSIHGQTVIQLAQGDSIWLAVVAASPEVSLTAPITLTPAMALGSIYIQALPDPSDC